MDIANINQDLKALKDFQAGKLESLKNLRFDFREWARHVPGHAPEENNFCGTTACAAGIMVLAPGSGYKTEWEETNYSSKLFFSYQDAHSTTAISKKWGFFDGDEDEAKQLMRRDFVTQLFGLGTYGKILDLIISALEREIVIWVKEDSTPEAR